MTADELNRTHPNGPTWEQGMPSHDPRVDTGAPTFERAIINLAHNIWMLYRDQPHVPNGAKLKKKHRW